MLGYSAIHIALFIFLGALAIYSTVEIWSTKRWLDLSIKDKRITPKSIYVAHNFDARLSLRELLKPIEQLGYLITSTWIYDDSHAESKNRTDSADDDVTDIERADIFLLFVDQFGDRPGRGKWFEWGYAVTSGKTVILVGEDTGCVFYWMTSENTYKCRTLEEAIKLLEEGICG